MSVDRGLKSETSSLCEPSEARYGITSALSIKLTACCSEIVYELQHQSLAKNSQRQKMSSSRCLLLIVSVSLSIPAGSESKSLSVANRQKIQATVRMIAKLDLALSPSDCHEPIAESDKHRAALHR